MLNEVYRGRIAMCIFIISMVLASSALLLVFVAVVDLIVYHLLCPEPIYVSAL
jgi:hypothetical protein